MDWLAAWFERFHGAVLPAQQKFRVGARAHVGIQILAGGQLSCLPGISCRYFPDVGRLPPLYDNQRSTVPG